MTNYQGTFRKLIAWQAAKSLTLEVYRLTKKFPKEELYALSSDMRRAAISNMSNIAEGNQRNGDADRLRFFNIAISSLVEVDNHADLSFSLGYISEDEYKRLLELINKSGYLDHRLIDSIKNPKSPNSQNSPKSPKKKGFSLVELIVVIAIIAVLSISSIVGFGHLGDVLRTREVAGMLEDILKQEEMKVLRGDFQKSTINFYEDYIVIEEDIEDSDLQLDLAKAGSKCSGSEYELTFDKKSALTKKNEEGETLQIKSVETSDIECVDFKKSDDREWSYQLISSDQVSDIIRFVHFNIQRENLDNEISISNGYDSKIEVRAPYGKKYIYAPGSSSPAETITLTVKDSNDNEDKIILK